MDLAALAATQAVDEGCGASVGANDTGVDGAQLKRRVGHRPVEPAHHIHVCEEAGQSGQVVLIDIIGQVTEARVAGQRRDSAHHDLMRQARD